MRAGTVLLALLCCVSCEQILGIHDVPMNNTKVDAPTDRLDGLTADSGSGSGSACVAIPEWGSATTYQVAGSFSLAVGTLDGHPGLVDIVVATGSDILLLPNLGSGTYAPAKSLRGSASPSPATNVLVADINHDGFDDVVAWTFLTDADHVSIYLQDAATPGTFESPTDFILPASPNAGAVGNFNGDSFPDLVFAGSGTITVYVSGSGTFSTGGPQIFSNVSALAALAIGNPNGVDDIAFTQPNGAPQVSFNEGSATFGALAALGEMTSQQVSFGHFGSGGPLDAVVVTDPFGLLFDESTPGTFALASGSAVAFAETGPASATLAIDLNGDGHADVVAPPLYALQCATPGTFFPDKPGTTLTLPTGFVVLVVDVNGDGKPDVIGFNQPTMPGTVSAAAVEVALHE